MAPTFSVTAPRFRLLIGSQLFVVIFAAVMISSCVNQPARAPSDAADVATVRTTSPVLPALAPPAVSLEMLEADLSSLPTESGEARASRLSTLWYEHAQRLEEISLAAKMAALLRSAQIASTPLLGETCRNPFNKRCRDLDSLYRQAVQETVKMLARTGWELPDLAPTRYRFSPDDAEALRDLRAWRIRLEEVPTEFDSIRPGIGLATVGCRAQSDELPRPEQLLTSICSPLTFVLRFDQLSNAEQITAHIDVVDAYQQSVIAITGEDTLLAGNIDAALLALDRDLNSHTAASHLYCLSLPTRGTTTAIALGDIQDLSSLIRNEMWEVTRDDVIRENLTFCFYPVSKDVNAPSEARILLAGVRELVTPRKSANLERAPVPMFFITKGLAAQHATVDVLRRLRRQSHTLARQRSRAAPILLRGVHLMDPEQNKESHKSKDPRSPLLCAAEELHVPVTTGSLANTSLFSALRALSREDTSDAPLQTPTPTQKEISVSPVI